MGIKPPYLKHNNTVSTVAMEGAGRKQWGVMGLGAKLGTHLNPLDLLRPGNYCERHSLPERQTACQYV